MERLQANAKDMPTKDNTIKAYITLPFGHTCKNMPITRTLVIATALWPLIAQRGVLEITLLQ